MGFGFRGSSPPWPYVGLGRGGLPRCGYFFNRGSTPVPPLYQASPFYGQGPATPGYAPFSPQMSREEELDYLRDQAEEVKEQLEQIESKMHDLESKE
jgi:hypothetical protein